MGTFKKLAQHNFSPMSLSSFLYLRFFKGEGRVGSWKNFGLLMRVGGLLERDSYLKDIDNWPLYFVFFFCVRVSVFRSFLQAMIMVVHHPMGHQPLL